MLEMKDIENVKYWYDPMTRAHREASTITVRLSGNNPDHWVAGFSNPDMRTGWWKMCDTQETAQAYAEALGFTSTDGTHYSK